MDDEWYRTGFGKISLQYKYTVYCNAVYRILQLWWAVYRNTAARLAVVLRYTLAPWKYGDTAAPCSSILQLQKNTTVFAVFQSLLLDFQYCASKVLGTRSANKGIGSPYCCTVSVAECAVYGIYCSSSWQQYQYILQLLNILQYSTAALDNTAVYTAATQLYCSIYGSSVKWEYWYTVLFFQSLYKTTNKMK